MSSPIKRLSSRSRVLWSAETGASGGGGVVGGSLRTAWAKPEQVFLNASFEGDRARSDVALLEPCLDAAHLAREDAQGCRQGNAVFGFFDQGEQALGALGNLGLVLGKAGDHDECRPGFLQDPGGLGLGRLADAGLELVHLGDVCDQPMLELGANLDQQPLDGASEVVARFGQHIEGRRLVVSRRGTAVFPRFCSAERIDARGSDQVFAQADADFAESGRGHLEALGRAAVLGLIAGAAAELGLGDGALRLGHAVAQTRELVTQHAECLVLRGHGRGRVGGSQGGHRIGKLGFGAPQVGGLKVGE